MGSPQALNALLVKGEIKPIVAPGRVRAGKFPDLATAVEQGFTDDAFNRARLAGSRRTLRRRPS